MTDLPIPPGFDLSGRRALVVGASSGIGKACATALAAQGAHVTCAARRLEALRDLAGALKDRGWQAEAASLDMTDTAAIAAFFENEEPFHIVVNSAGIARHSAALETTPEDFSTVMDVNVRAAYFLSVEAARSMIAGGVEGSIIQISSQMGHVGGIDRALYCASKHAVEGFVKSMAIEWGRNRIRINTICPTFIRTPFTEATFDNPERVKWIEEKIKLGRTGEVEDIMGAVVYLAADASSLVTGTALMVDGGWTAD